MSLIDIFGQDAACPACGSIAAKKLLFFIRCPNRACVHGGAPAPKRKPEAAKVQRRAEAEWPVDPEFAPGAEALAVRYKNFLGEEKVFTGDRRTLRDAGRHVSLAVAPSGQRIALAKERILNLPDVQARLPAAAGGAASPAPTPLERQILGYHQKHATTSPAYEEILRKHPEWRDA